MLFLACAIIGKYIMLMCTSVICMSGKDKRRNYDGLSTCEKKAAAEEQTEVEYIQESPEHTHTYNWY